MEGTQQETEKLETVNLQQEAEIKQTATVNTIFTDSLPQPKPLPVPQLVLSHSQVHTGAKISKSLVK